MKSKKSATHSVARHHKPIHLKPKHAKPVLRWHVTSLLILMLLLGVLLVEAVSLFSGRSLLRGQLSTMIDNLYESAASQSVIVHSTKGFSMAIDLEKYAVTAQATDNGQTREYRNVEVAADRGYTVLQLAPKQPLAVPQVSVFLQPKPNYAQLTSQYGTDKHLLLAARHFADSSTAESEVVPISEAGFVNSGHEYYRISYKVVSKLQSKGSFSFGSFRTDFYVTLINDQPLLIKISSLQMDDATQEANRHQIIDNLFVDGIPAAVLPNNLPKLSMPSLLPKAQAASSVLSTDTQSKNAIKYTPAVVKIYHRVCGIIEINGTQVGAKGCDGGTGSGFLVSSDGYIATNGHVISLTAKDVVVQQMLSSGDVFVQLFQLLGYSNQEIGALVTRVAADPSSILSIIKGVYDLPDNKLHFVDSKEDYFVSVGKDPLDTTDILNPDHILKATKTVVSAKLTGMNYEAYDLYSVALSKGFTGSDVALLKVDGTDFPVVQLGQVSTLTQGASVTVIGFPGNAENSFASDKTIQPTVTKGTVSAVKDASGNSKKIVQSDVNISHGNSGGPALDESGKVFGLATYSIDTQQTGDALISYMRDIKDLQDLAKTKNITFVAKSAVQTEWEKGVDNFFAAKFSKAIKSFEKVNQLYPAHSLASDYIAIAKAKIANGEEVKDSSLYLVLGAVVVVVVVIGVLVLVMVKHHGKHQVYKVTQQGVAVVAPMTIPPANSLVSPAAADVPTGAVPAQSTVLPPTQPTAAVQSPVAPQDRLQ